MNRWDRWLLTAVLSGSVLVPGSLYAQAPASSDAPPTQNTEKDKDKKDSKQKKPSQREAYKELATPYKKWLSEDVIYIITDQERRAFMALQTNEEREQFIEQFWQTPQPGSRLYR